MKGQHDVSHTNKEDSLEKFSELTKMFYEFLEDGNLPEAGHAAFGIGLVVNDLHALLWKEANYGK